MQRTDSHIDLVFMRVLLERISDACSSALRTNAKSTPAKLLIVKRRLTEDGIGGATQVS